MTPRDQMSTSAKRNGEGVLSRRELEARRTFSTIFLSRDDLWRTVSKRPHPRIHPLALLKFPPKPEIRNLDVDPLIEEYVLELEITMDDTLAMEVCHAEDELAEDAARFSEGEAALFDEVVKELATGAELGHKVDGRFGRDKFVEGEDMRVAQSAVVVDFAGEEGERGGRVRGVLWVALGMVKVRGDGRSVRLITALQRGRAEKKGEKRTYGGEALGHLLDRNPRVGQAMYAQSDFSKRAYEPHAVSLLLLVGA